MGRASSRKKIHRRFMNLNEPHHSIHYVQPEEIGYSPNVDDNLEALIDRALSSRPDAWIADDCPEGASGNQHIQLRHYDVEVLYLNQEGPFKPSEIVADLLIHRDGKLARIQMTEAWW